MPAEFESGVFAAVPAWHGLGVVLPSKSLDTGEALAHSGLAGWNLQKVPAYAPDLDGNLSPQPGVHWIQRQTDGRCYGPVGDVYTPFQNEAAFAFVDDLLGEGCHIHTAGSLRGGATVWVLAKAPDSIRLPDSRVDSFILLTHNNDGNGSIVATTCAVRVVCSNTLRAALGEHRAALRVRHTKTAGERLQEAHRILGVNREAVAALKARARELTATTLSAADFDAFLTKLIPDAPADATSSRGATLAQNARQSIADIYTGDALGQPQIIGTAWGAYNAVVAYNDHAITGRNTARSTAAEARFGRILGADNITDRALALLS